MSNHCETVAHFRGSKEDIIKLKSIVAENPTNMFDFKKIIPIPHDIYLTNICREYPEKDMERIAELMGYTLNFDDQVFSALELSTKTINVHKTTIPELTKLEIEYTLTRFNDISETEISIEDYLLAVECGYPVKSNLSIIGEVMRNIHNTIKYGYANLPIWCLANWGTKHNSIAANVCNITENQLYIQCITVWSPPKKIFIKLGEMFPSIKGYGIYSDISNFTEVFRILHGEHESYSIDVFGENLLKTVFNLQVSGFDKTENLFNSMREK